MPPKKTTEPPNEAPNLAVSRAEARSKLEERIAKGKELAARHITTRELLDAAESDHGKWSAFNNELLKRLFTNDTLADEYSRFYGGVLRMNPSFHELVRMHQENVADGLHRLESIVERLELYKEPTLEQVLARPTPVSSRKKTRVFVVHGHDDAAKESAARAIEHLGLEAVILHEKPTGGRTIIEKLEHYGKADFAVVLLTPDDFGCAKADKDSLKPRARQNVVLELGYFIGLLGRAHVCALHKGGLELPSDFVGVGYVAMDESNAWKMLLARELRAAGFDIDMNRAL